MPPAPPSSSSASIEEPVQYKDEIITFGNMSLLDQLDQYAAAAEAPATRNRQGSVEINKKDIGSASKRPVGWAEIRLRRVFLKEWEDRKNGVDEDDILDKRYQRELEVTN